MHSLLLNILRALVQVPESLELVEVKGDSTTFLEIRCDPQDVGSIIGKNGKTISAIRVLINAITTSPDHPVIIEVIEPTGP